MRLPLRRRLTLAVRAALTASGVAPSGFFVPCRWAREVRPPDYPAVGRLLAAREPRFRELVLRSGAHADIFAGFDGPPPAPRLRQDWFPRLDAVMAYTLVHEVRPRRIVEIGSGHSTRFLARAVLDAGLDCAIICIDPAPRATLAGLLVRHLPRRLEQLSAELFGDLQPGDMLFVDSSHIAVPGSDVDHLFHRILPELPPGVLLHVHDVFLPDPYPPEWSWRGYGEQLLLASWLLAGGLEPVFSSHWVATRMPEVLACTAVGRLPLAEGVHETSFWAWTTDRRSPTGLGAAAPAP